MFKILTNYWRGFKRRWNIESDWQVIVILIVFTLTGTTTMFVHAEFNKLIGLGDDGHFLLKLVVFLLLVLPLYNTLLIIYGTLLGQYKFFKFFIIKFFSNIFKVFKRKKKDKVSSAVEKP